MRVTRWLGGILGAAAVAAIVVSCGGTGGGGGGKDNPEPQFILNSNNSGRLILNVAPGEVDANKSDRIGLVAVLTDSRGNGISRATITFSSDIDDISFLPGSTTSNGVNFGTAVTDASGRADIIAVAGSTPTGTGDIVGTGTIFAEPPTPFGLRAEVPITLLDVGFIDADVLSVIPSSIQLVEPAPGQVVFFNIVGGTPPYLLKNEVNGIGSGTISQHCVPGCTENGGTLCIGSPCQSDGDCNLNGSASPAGVCIGPIKRCLASCRGTNCGGSRCDTDADCNDGSATPADVCKDSGQSIAFTINDNPADGTQGFVVEDSAGASVNVEVTATFICGNGTARGDEQCDLGDLRGATCESLGRPAGALLCSTDCAFDFTGCTGAGSTPGTPGPGGPTPTGVTPTPTGATPTGITPTPSPAGTPGSIGSLELALLSLAGGDNGNNTATTVIAAVVSGSNGNPVADGTVVNFGLTAPTFGAVITAQSTTGTLPPQCDIQNYVARTGVQVLQQPGVAHACITYPIDSVGDVVTVNATSPGAPSDSGSYTLPIAFAGPVPVPTSTP